MASRSRDYDESEGSPDPESLYTKEYCIGLSHCYCGTDELETDLVVVTA
jgi:hypothetical protein